MPTGPKLLVTGFGPFPGAPENPTEALVRALANVPADRFGAAALRAIVLPTDYRKSWLVLRRAYKNVAPDIVMHFGFSRNADGLVIERAGKRRVDSGRPDSAGFAPRSGFCRRSGPESLATTLPVDAILTALTGAGFAAALSEDAGGYVCNATLYRSLQADPEGKRLVGFIHVPPEGTNGYTQERLGSAALLVLRKAAAAWSAARESAGRRRAVNAL